MDADLREAWFKWDELAEQSERKEIWIGEHVADSHKRADADDLKTAFSEDCDIPYHELITKALRSGDDTALGRLCRRILDGYYTVNAEIDWEAKNG